MLQDQLPTDWRELCHEEINADYFRELTEFVQVERAAETIFPPDCDVFNAFRQTPIDQTRVLILGQDPYHDDGQAHGLCFSVRSGVKPPPSLVNIFKELHTDIGCSIPSHGCLDHWAAQGVLLLNTVLTVRAHQANSHRGQGWEKFTDAVIGKLSQRERRMVFVLWGKPAQKKHKLIDDAKHVVIESAHPSPLSAFRGFFGSRPFSQINDALTGFGEPCIDWCLE
ncbi:MAG: uracil-DNA glycosylase [Planctomycetaceae bacterium]|nr:uracil-DNA glycosylase [Planctomycetaceae bacterium]